MNFFTIDRIREFCKKETVFVVACVVAVFSMFFVKPGPGYIGYIDFRVLALLFSLMLVVSGLRNEGIFDKLCVALLHIVKDTRMLAFVLVLICFFTSMWITNDVSLITFVPFAIMVITRLDRREMLIPVIVLQTIAANLGSMCTPIGNPQNLYLYSISNMSIVTFGKLLLPITAASLIMIVVSLLFVKKEALKELTVDVSSDMAPVNKIPHRGRIKTVIYLVLFVVCILTVLNIVPYIYSLVLVVAAVFVLDRKLLKEADYILLLTFVAFFIFVGNMKNITAINAFFDSHVRGNEVIVSVLASQVISNVPAAVLLSGFTTNYGDLLIGTNIGGLGTLIASMASLISYKFYCQEEGCNSKKYVIQFTVYNIIFLVILLFCQLVCRL